MLVRNKHVVRMGKEPSDPRPLGSDFIFFLSFTTLQVCGALGHALLVRSRHVVRTKNETSDPRPLGPIFFFFARFSTHVVGCYF